VTIHVIRADKENKLKAICIKKKNDLCPVKNVWHIFLHSSVQYCFLYGKRKALSKRFL